MSATPNFAAVARDIRDIREQRAECVERELTCIERWRADVDLADNAIAALDHRAEDACKAIKAAMPLTSSEVVAICAALFRALQQQSHVDINRTALACLSDIVADFSADAQEQ
jgi:hypothetical protein